MKKTTAFIICAIVFILSAALSLFGAWNTFDSAEYDLLLSEKIASAPLKMSPRIIPVDLNDRAEQNLGQRIDNREAFTELLTVLGEGELSGGMDFLFAGSKDIEKDSEMAAAASKLKSLVLAVVPLDKETSGYSGTELSEADNALLEKYLYHPVVENAGSIPRAETFLLPNRELLKNTACIRHIGVIQDSDGVYRRVPLFYRYHDGYVPSLPLALAVQNLGIDPSKMILSAGKSLVAVDSTGRKICIPIDKSGNVLIPYPSYWKQGWSRIPMDKISDAGKAAREGDDTSLWNTVDALDGGIVVCADITTAAKDFGRTPFETVYPLSGIHTAVLNAFVTGTFFKPIALFVYMLLLLLLFAGAVFALLQKKNVRYYISFAVLLLAAFAVPAVFWFASYTVVPIAATVVSVLLCFVIGTVLRIEQAHEQRVLLQNALSRYFPRALAARILAEKRTDLKPADKVLTILFSDISSFTKWSSDKTPETVHAFLSDYLESMAEIIFANGGTVDKFIGDGILAFFGDPYEQSDHTERALRTAIQMQKKVALLRDKWQPVVGIDLKIRIGVNTGNVIVGNLGTKARIDYTVIGSTVNLASRMESNAPVGGILVAHAARERVGDKFKFTERVEVAAKGYEQPVEAFVLDQGSLSGN